MSIYYSASARGFFHKDVHGDKRPTDCVPITHDEWQALLAAQSAGKEIRADESGRPVAAERIIAPEQRAATVRLKRDAALSVTDGLVARHRDERETGKTTLTDAQFVALLTHRQALRDLPAHPDFPHVPLPVNPLD